MSDAPLTPLQMKAARELLGWSQMDVANRVGLSEWVIGFYERGERLIRACYLRRMRSIFRKRRRRVHRGERRRGGREAQEGRVNVTAGDIYIS
jgi:ribosome-binding protein aMBF1 (putative translation factor)